VTAAAQIARRMARVRKQMQALLPAEVEPVCPHCGDGNTVQDADRCADCLRLQSAAAEDERMDNRATAGSWSKPDGED
jgi:hypothetical protein